MNEHHQNIKISNNTYEGTACLMQYNKYKNIFLSRTKTTIHISANHSKTDFSMFNSIQLILDEHCVLLNSSVNDSLEYNDLISILKCLECILIRENSS